MRAANDESLRNRRAMTPNQTPHDAEEYYVDRVELPFYVVK